jgi:hypothetical protein
MERGNFIYLFKNPTMGDRENFKKFLEVINHKPSKEKSIILNVNSFSFNEEYIIMNLTYRSEGHNMRYVIRERMNKYFGAKKVQ